MKTYGALFLGIILAISGCVARPGSDDVSPAKDTSPVKQAAATSIDALPAAFADAADDVAGRAGTFKSWEEFYAAWNDVNAKIESSTLGGWTDAMNAEFGLEKQPDGTVKETKPYDAELAAKIARYSANGFRSAK